MTYPKSATPWPAGQGLGEGQLCVQDMSTSPYSHVTAWFGLDQVLSWEAALHDVIKARIPNILGKLQKQKSISGCSIINAFHSCPLLIHLMIYLVATKK